MSSKGTAIKVESISKRYRIGVKENIHDSFVSTIFNFLKSPLENYRKYRSLYKFDDIEFKNDSSSITDSSSIIWALRDVSFEVERGEVIGIIGNNGAGKSSLLKILCKITDPTSGYAEIHGKVSSLLEVGTGFHQELTGRENVYLNGTILGMRKKEVDRKFDEIVDFSGVEKFIDTPVKRYSSGMKVRLAFAVAAYLEPEILLVDEVLAVGDAAFQKKCLDKMGNVAKGGRTIILVSHNMSAIRRLCGRVLWLESGQVKLSGASSEVVSSYLSTEVSSHTTWINSSPQTDDKGVQMKSARILSMDNQPLSIVEFDKQFKVEIEYEIINPIRNLSILSRLTDEHGNIVLTSWDTDSTDLKGRVRGPGCYLSICKIPRCLLKPGRYYLTIGSLIHKEKEMDSLHDALTFEVSHVGYHLNLERLGVITPLLEWQVTQTDNMNEDAQNKHYQTKTGDFVS